MACVPAYKPPLEHAPVLLDPHDPLNQHGLLSIIYYDTVNLTIPPIWWGSRQDIPLLHTRQDIPLLHTRQDMLLLHTRQGIPLLPRPRPRCYSVSLPPPPHFNTFHRNRHILTNPKCENNDIWFHMSRSIGRHYIIRRDITTKL